MRSERPILLRARSDILARMARLPSSDSVFMAGVRAKLSSELSDLERRLRAMTAAEAAALEEQQQQQQQPDPPVRASQRRPVSPEEKPKKLARRAKEDDDDDDDDDILSPPWFWMLGKAETQALANRLMERREGLGVTSASRSSSDPA